ncbi:MAG TPA: IS66 family transposase [Steroidobacteraceae bacterium]|nr:IS66 family transposase [Steroidobacteraceae bacterium]
MPAALDLPNDVDTLKRLVVEGQAALEAAQALLLSRQLEVHRLKLQIAKLKRLHFGRASQRVTGKIEQLEFALEELEAAEAAAPATPVTADKVGERSARRALPTHLPREEVVHPAPSSDPAACPVCGCSLSVVGEDVAEVLEHGREGFKVLRHVRPKLSCGRCELVLQAPAASRPIARGVAGPGMLAHVLVSKYADHLPLYRQSQIYARAGLELDRSTLSHWVGGTHALLEPLIEVLGRHVLCGTHLHADDAPYPVIAPGTGKSRTARIWTYVRDERPWASPVPAAVLFRYTSDRKGQHPRIHLAGFSGTLHADGYAGFDRLFEGARIQEAASWAHVRQKFAEIHSVDESPIAGEALARIAVLYEIENEILGQSPDQRRGVRAARSVGALADLHDWLSGCSGRLPKRSELDAAIRYTLSRWQALCRYCDDGRAEIDNVAAERALRAIGLGARGHLFAGADTGGERAAGIYSLIGSARLNDLEPEAYLRFVIERIVDYPIGRLEELLPWNVVAQLRSPRAAAHP